MKYQSLEEFLAYVEQRFKLYLSGKKVVCLDIPDNYQFMQPELVSLLNKRVLAHLR